MRPINRFEIFVSTSIDPFPPPREKALWACCWVRGTVAVEGAPRVCAWIALASFADAERLGAPEPFRPEYHDPRDAQDITSQKRGYREINEINEINEKIRAHFEG